VDDDRKRLGRRREEGLLDRWVSMGEAAEKSGTNVRRMRRRLVILDQQIGGGILRRRKRNFEVNIDALARVTEVDVVSLDETAADLACRVEALERRLEMLRSFASRRLSTNRRVTAKKQQRSRFDACSGHAKLSRCGSG